MELKKSDIIIVIKQDFHDVIFNDRKLVNNLKPLDIIVPPGIVWITSGDVSQLHMLRLTLCLLGVNFRAAF